MKSDLRKSSLISPFLIFLLFVLTAAQVQPWRGGGEGRREKELGHPAALFTHQGGK